MKAEQVEHRPLALAQKDGESAVSILANIRARTGGWFDCACGDCIIHGDDFHAWEAFEREAVDAIHYACLYLAEQDFNELAVKHEAIGKALRDLDMAQHLDGQVATDPAAWIDSAIAYLRGALGQRHQEQEKP